MSDSFGQEQPKERKDNAFAPYTPESSNTNQALSKKALKQKKRALKRSRKKGEGYSYLENLDKKKEEFEERMKENAKEYKKLQRKMKKPQYSDPMYFGHKKKPKKRPVGKRKLCKECGIVH